jgi:ankyrin repeat protein
MGEPIAVAALLLDLGVDINAIGGQYDTALIAASFSDKAELVKWLLEHGVDVRYRSREYGTALDVIRASERYRHTQDQADIIYMLSKAGLE